MLGSPIAHSRSPQLHLAAYRALGLDGWTYDRIECTADELPIVVGGFGPEWVGVSVTMPGKFAALRFADERTPRAELVGSANTLVRSQDGWRADNTDIDGVKGALGAGVRPGGRAGLGRHRARRRRWARRAWGATTFRSSRETATKRRRCWRSGPRWVSTVGWVELGATVLDVDVVVSTIPADVGGAGMRRHRRGDSTAARRDLRSVADPAGGGRRGGGRTGDQRAADAATPGVRSGRAVHRAARAHRGDEGRAGRTVVFDE